MKLRRPLALALAMAAGSAHAGSVADLGLSLEQIRALNAQLTAPIAAPGISFGTPTGFGASWGQTFAGLGGRTVSSGTSDVDGSALVGFGLGDPSRFLGLETAINIISLQEGFAEDGSWGFKLHRALPFRGAVAIGVDDTGGWGDAKEKHSSAYAVYTQVIDLNPQSPKRPMGLAFSAGLGDERFAAPGDDVGALASVALSWQRQASVIVDWHAGELHVAASGVPLYQLPLVITAGFINVTERFGDTEFAAGIGYLHRF